jgi:hypothetical protein
VEVSIKLLWLVQGWWVVQAEECWHQSLVPLMERVREKMGDSPVYLSFDIDAIGQLTEKLHHSGQVQRSRHSLV